MLASTKKILPPWKIFRTIADTAEQMGVEAYVVGGFVRDRLLANEFGMERPNAGKDIDVVVVGNGIAFAEAVANALDPVPKVNVFKNFGTANFLYRNREIDFVGARKESYRANSRKPIVENGTLEDDQLRRDFSINALAVSLFPDFGTLIDPFDGLDDLEKGIIRTPLEPGITYSDDPLRMMRAIRFAAQLGFRIDPDSLQAIRDHAHRLPIVSTERISEELNKILLSKKPSVGLRLLEETHLLPLMLPELQALKGVEHQEGKGHKDNFYHTLQVVDQLAELTDDLWVRWAAVLHDIAKPATKRYEQGHGWTFHGHEELGARWVHGIFKRLKLPLNEKKKQVENLVRLHLRPIALTKEEVTDSAVRRLVFDAGDDLEALMMLCRADITSRNEVKVRRYLKRFDEVEKKIRDVEERDQIRNWQPPVSGTDIMDLFQIPPSETVGLLKDGLKDAILDGQVANNKEEAMQWVISRAESLGLSPMKPLPELPKEANAN